MALERALRYAVSIIGRSVNHLDSHAKRRAQMVRAESIVFLVEVQAALHEQTPQNINGVAHRATAWLALFRSMKGSSTDSHPGTILLVRSHR